MIYFRFSYAYHRCTFFFVIAYNKYIYILLLLLIAVNIFYAVFSEELNKFSSHDEPKKLLNLKFLGGDIFIIHFIKFKDKCCNIH